MAVYLDWEPGISDPPQLWPVYHPAPALSLSSSGISVGTLSSITFCYDEINTYKII